MAKEVVVKDHQVTAGLHSGVKEENSVMSSYVPDVHAACWQHLNDNEIEFYAIDV